MCRIGCFKGRSGELGFLEGNSSIKLIHFNKVTKWRDKSYDSLSKIIKLSYQVRFVISLIFSFFPLINSTHLSRISPPQILLRSFCPSFYPLTKEHPFYPTWDSFYKSLHYRFIVLESGVNFDLSYWLKSFVKSLKFWMKKWLVNFINKIKYILFSLKTYT